MIDDDRDPGKPMTRLQAARFCEMSPRQFDRKVRPYLTETILDSGAPAKVYFLRSQVNDFWLRRFGGVAVATPPTLLTVLEGRTRARLNAELRRKGKPTI